MPVPLRIPCPHCGKVLHQKRDGRCPECGGPVSAHVEAVRGREERIEKIVAIIGTALVILVSLFTGGLGLVEGVVMYAAAGGGMFYFCKKNFKTNREAWENR